MLVGYENKAKINVLILILYANNMEVQKKNRLNAYY